MIDNLLCLIIMVYIVPSEKIPAIKFEKMKFHYSKKSIKTNSHCFEVTKSKNYIDKKLRNY